MMSKFIKLALAGLVVVAMSVTASSAGAASRPHHPVDHGKWVAASFSPERTAKLIADAESQVATLAIPIHDGTRNTSSAILLTRKDNSRAVMWTIDSDTLLPYSTFTIAFNKKGTYIGSVQNDATITADGYALRLFEDGELVSSKTITNSDLDRALAKSNLAPALSGSADLPKPGNATVGCDSAVAALAFVVVMANAVCYSTWANPALLPVCLLLLASEAGLSVAVYFACQ